MSRSVWVHFFGEDPDGEIVAYEWALAPPGADERSLQWTRTRESSVEIVFEDYTWPVPWPPDVPG